MANEENLLKILRDIAKKEDYGLADIDIKPISSGGANYTTDLYLSKISEPPKSDINIFAKVANLTESARANTKFATYVYVTETLFYTELVNHFERLYNKHNVPINGRLAIPKYYGHSLNNYEETMVLENLEASGYENFDRMKVFDWEYAAAAVTQMARFHAIGIAFKEENPEEFDKVVSNFKADILKEEELIQGMMNQTIQSVCEALSGDLKIRFQNYVETIDLMEVFVKTMEYKTFLMGV